MATNTTKDTIYIDIDDEITAIIDKVSLSKHKIVALVLPKRATVLQSIVNMKLLKRTADENDKHLVLITTEAGLLPLAGAVGLHVAATPQSKPVIPHNPTEAIDDTEEVEEGTTFDLHENASKPIGALAGTEAEEDTIQLDNEEDEAEKPTGGRRGAAAKAKKGKNKKLKIPDFNRFRTRLILGIVALFLLIGLWVLAAIVLPKATVAIKTDSEEIDLTLDVNFDTKATEVDTEEMIVPAKVEQTPKTTTQSVAASGERNDGEKARGSVVMIASVCSPPLKAPNDVEAGTGVSTGGKNYITQEKAQFNYSGSSGGCFIFKSQSVNITAQNGGSNYNVNDATFTVSGSSATAQGSASGGTDNIVKVVSQSDINSAKEKLAAQTDEGVKEDLIQKMDEAGLFVIEESFNAGTPEVTVSAKAGDQVDSVTVTQKTTYSVIAAQKSDLDTLITANAEKEIDTSKQKILNTGLDKAVFKLQNQQDNSTKVLMSMDVNSLAGPKLDDDAIKSQIAGKKAADAEEILRNYPGVTDVTIKYSPFWVSSIPKNADKITITYEK